jgi:hypothetical protein
MVTRPCRTPHKQKGPGRSPGPFFILYLYQTRHEFTGIIG